MARPKTGAITIPHEKFTESIAVSENSKLYAVPATADANRKANQLVAEQLRKFLKKHIRDYDKLGKTLLPKELMDLTAAAKNIAEISYKAHEGAPPDLESPGGSAMGKLVGTAVYAVAKGMTDGKNAKSPEDLMQAIDTLGKKAHEQRQPDKVVDITPEKQDDTGPAS